MRKETGAPVYIGEAENVKAINPIKDKYEVCWKDFEVVNDKQGRPKLNIIGIDLKDIENIDLSISHCKEYAVANVTVLGR